MLTNLQKKYDYTDVLIVPNDSDIPSRSLVKLERDFKFRWSKQVLSGVGIIAANMDSVGTLDMSREMAKFKCFTALHKHHSEGELVSSLYSDSIRKHSFFTLGTSKREEDMLDRLMEHKLAPLMVCIDIANGYLNILLDSIRRIRSKYPDLIIMAGNVVTGERAVKLIEAGADIVKVGIGPGSACTTRKQTGVGYPQLSAVYECARAVEAIGGLVCADGGCTVPGDVSKAFIAGADFVMLGGMLAGHAESGGTVIEFEKVLSPEVKVMDLGNGPEIIWRSARYARVSDLPEEAWEYTLMKHPQMLFYGMSSDTAMEKYNGGLAEYRSSEGRTVKIPYRGKVENTIKDILGGIRSTMTYIGIDEISKMAYSAKLVETNNQLNTVFVK